MVRGVRPKLPMSGTENAHGSGNLSSYLEEILRFIPESALRTGKKNRKVESNSCGAAG